MCLRIRQEQAERKVTGTTLEPPRSQGLRPRLVGAAAVALVAGLAAAAFVVPTSMQPSPPPAQHSAAPALPVAATTAPTPGAQEQAAAPSVLIEQTLSGGDDGVPTNTDLARMGAAVGCQHEL